MSDRLGWQGFLALILACLLCATHEMSRDNIYFFFFLQNNNLLTLSSYPTVIYKGKIKSIQT